MQIDSYYLPPEKQTGTYLFIIVTLKQTMQHVSLFRGLNKRTQPIWCK